MALAKGHRQNFDTLRRAMLAGDAALLECQLVASGEPAAVICAANRLHDGEIAFAPFAMLFSGNPYLAVNPPNPDGGFFSQTEVWQGEESRSLAATAAVAAKAAREIRLPCFGITICLDREATAEQPARGTIRSDLHERGRGRMIQKLNAAMDGLEALVLAHACAGIDVASPAYVEGIETAVDAIGNALF